MKRRTLKSRLLAFLLVLCMIVGLTPVYAVTEGEIVAEYFINPGMADDDGVVHVEFTPEEDGHYFLVVWPEYDAFMSCSHGAEPVDSFPFDDDYGYGSVYELKAGQTYCFAQHYREGYAYTAYMKKVSVAETFEIPETLTGYAGTTIWLNIDFEGALSTEVTSSDLTVVNTETGGNAHGHDLELLKPGTATVTVTSHNGVVKTCEVTVKEPGQIALDEVKKQELNPGESVAYTFVPAESGDYIVHRTKDSAWTEIRMYGAHNGDLEWFSESCEGRLFYDLIAGETYTITVTYPEWYESAETVNVSLTKGTETEGFTIEGKTKGLLDSNVDFWLQFTPEFGVSDDITWSVSDESIAEVVLDTNVWCNLYLKTAGTVTLTATSQQDETKTASVEITVEEPKTIEVGETVEVNLQPGEEVVYNFSADGKAGQYMFMIPRDATCGCGWWSNANDTFDFYTDEYECHVFDLPEDGHVQFSLNLNKQDSAISTTLTLVEAVEATDIAFPNGDTVEIGVGEQVRVPMELVDGNYIRDMNIDSSDYNVAWLNDWSGESLTLYSDNPGTATITVTGANGFSKELTVVSHPYGYNIPDENKWVGTTESWEVVTVEYTPEKDGYYFFHHQDVPSLIPAEGSAQPLADFWYNEYGVWGNVYQLEGGKTYTFVSEHEWVGDYAYFVKEVFMAEDFKIPSEMNGAVNQRRWLGVEKEGVFSATYKSSNEDVVLVADGGSDGVNIFLIGEGTADITVTDHNGKEKVCTVTVSGKASIEEFWGDAHLGLAAGGSITYSYVPGESGLYWVHSGEEANVDISLTANGEALTPKFSYGSGKVYELTAETEYMITVSSEETVVTYLRSMSVVEPTRVEFGGEEIEFYEGDQNGLGFDLSNDEGYWAVAEVSAESSDESVIKITSCYDNVVWFETVGVGTATITVTTHNGLSDSIEVTVLERPVLKLNEVVKQTLKRGEGPLRFFTAEKAGDYELTITTSGVSVFATDKMNSQDESTYVEEIFEGPATKTYKQHMEAGDTWVYTIVNLGEEDIDTTMVLTRVHELTAVKETAASCTTDGMKAHYKCADCGKLFADAEGKTEVTAADLVVKGGHKLTKVEAVEPTYDAAGNVEYYTCSECGKLFADAEGKTEITAESVILPQLIKVEENTAVVSPEAVDKAVEEAAKADEVVIDVSGAEVAEVELPVTALETLVEAEKPLTLVTGEATVTLDTATLAAVTEAANGAEITIRVEQIETKTLNKKQQEAVADREVLVTISANVYAGDEYIGDFKGGKATVKVPLKLEEGEKAEDYTVFYLDDDGKLTPVETFVKNGDIYFVTGHFSEYVVLKTATTEKEPVDNDNPPMGDHSDLFMMTTLLVGSLVALAFVALNGKKYAYVGKWER